MFFQGFKINSGFTNFLRFEILGLKIEEEGWRFWIEDWLGAIWFGFKMNMMNGREIKHTSKNMTNITP
jgi:hypothetical protein